MKIRFNATILMLMAVPLAAHAQSGDPLLNGDIVAGDNAWSYHPIAGAKCRRGGDTGIAVRMVEGAKKLVITFQGGGACYNSASCLVSSGEFGESEFLSAADGTTMLGTKLTEGIWHREDANAPPVLDNEISDYSQVYIAYCSGDFHAGNKVTYVDGVWGQQTFAGYENTGLCFDYIVHRLVPQLGPDAEVLLSGISAGAFGATVNAPRLREKLPPEVRMTLLNDSAPFFDSSLMIPCLQQRWHDTFGLDTTLLPACGPTCTASNWMNPFLEHLLQSEPDLPFAFISTTDDFIIQLFMTWLTVGSGCSLNPNESEYRAGLLRIREQMLSARASEANVATYFIPNSSEHGFIQRSEYYTTIEQSLPLQTWVEGLFDRSSGGVPQAPQYLHVGP